MESSDKVSATTSAGISGEQIDAKADKSSIAIIPPPRMIYHYTKQSGLIGILTTKIIWATRIHHLNDASEFSYAVQVAKHAIDEIGKQSLNQAQADTMKEIESRLQGVARINIHVACFSERADLLSQWRAYCPGGGYSIGFTASEIQKVTERQGFFLASCIYDWRKQITLMGIALEGLMKTIAEDETKCSSSVDSFIGGFLRVAPLIKHSSFEEEREWRVVSGPISGTHPQLFVREGKSMPIPTFKLQLSDSVEQKLPLQVVVGPCPHPQLAMDAVSALMFCTQTGGGVSLSNVPHRDW